MGRIRTIKPEFPDSETIGHLSREARLLFIQLWTIADDYGKSRAASRMLASRLYPYDDDAPTLIEGWLSELEKQNAIIRYKVDGSSYLQIVNWDKHQKVDKPTKSRIPDPLDDPRESYREGGEPSSTDLGPWTLDLGPEDLEESSSLRSDAAANDSALGDTSSYSDLNKAVLSRVIVPAREVAPQTNDLEKAAKNAERNGSRLPDDWNPGSEGAKFARELGIDPARTFDRFRDYWRGVAGAKGRKLDWLGTWRNWCRKEAEDRGTLPLAPIAPTPSNPGGHAVTPMTGGF